MTANQIAYQRLIEERRANKASESLKLRERKEAERHNLEQETIDRGKLQESSRHNMIQEGIDSSSLTLNRLKESHTYSLNQANLEETHRSNLARETETQRHNTVSETSSVGGALSSLVHTILNDAGSNKTVSSMFGKLDDVLDTSSEPLVRKPWKEGWFKTHVYDKVMSILNDRDLTYGQGRHF